VRLPSHLKAWEGEEDKKNEKIHPLIIDVTDVVRQED